MALTVCASAGCARLGGENVENSRVGRVYVDTSSGAAGVQTHTARRVQKDPPDVPYASRCVSLLNPWRRMIFNRLE
jgi:hypothetical protein